MSRQPVLAGLGAGLLLLTAACQKDSPQVTLVSNGRSVHVAASNWCRGRTFTQETDCVTDGPKTTLVKVRSGDTVGIDVDSELADSGWVIYDPVTRQNSEILKKHYYAFNATFGNGETGAFLEVHQVQRARTGNVELNRVTGIWRFQLVATS